MTEERFFSFEEYPHGLRCADCNREFVEGQPLAERLFAMSMLADGEPAYWVDLLCVGCAVAVVGS